MTPPLLLGIETSCDETSAAVLSGKHDLLGHVIHSQDEHLLYGGVVPELAARAHLTRLDDVVARALSEAGVTFADLDAIAVTAGPGLIGALLVGVTWAKAVAYGMGIPLVPVHHMEAHLFSPALEDPDAEPPFVALLVSGGHTMLLFAEAWGNYRLLGTTRDDAAGEAFDKVAGALGLPYPGGPHLETAARGGTQGRYKLPRPMLRSNQRPGDDDYYDFSFSGLKTASLALLEDVQGDVAPEEARVEVARAFQDAAVDVLVRKTLRAVEVTGCRRVLLGGGVSANRALRDRMRASLGVSGQLFHASPRLSVDNGAMVARAGLFRLAVGDVGHARTTANANLPFPGMMREDSSGSSPMTPIESR